MDQTLPPWVAEMYVPPMDLEGGHKICRFLEYNQNVH